MINIGYNNPGGPSKKSKVANVQSTPRLVSSPAIVKAAAPISTAIQHPATVISTPSFGTKQVTVALVKQIGRAHV